MKLPITRETTGWATSLTRSQVSRPSRRSQAPVVMARISSSCSAIRLGVKPRWKSALSRSCCGGSIPMNIAWVSSSGRIAWVIAVTPCADEYVSQSRLTACTSSARVTDQKPSSSGYSGKCGVQWIGHSARMRLNRWYGGPSIQWATRSLSSTSSIGTCSAERSTVMRGTLTAARGRGYSNFSWSCRGRFDFPPLGESITVTGTA
jgi:hypothetical protein